MVDDTDAPQLAALGESNRPLPPLTFPDGWQFGDEWRGVQPEATPLVALEPA